MKLVLQWLDLKKNKKLKKTQKKMAYTFIQGNLNNEIVKEKSSIKHLNNWDITFSYGREARYTSSFT